MKVTPLSLSGLILLDPIVYKDGRGFFFESFNQNCFNESIGCEESFVQDNYSRSRCGVLRGLHYQVSPHSQGKLVRVITGEILDVAVDLRRSSATFGGWLSVRLSEKNKSMLWVPAGFAHGFLTLSKQADVLYKTTDYYSPTCERSIRWDDPDIGIDWGDVSVPILSEKDAAAVAFSDAELFD